MKKRTVIVSLQSIITVAIIVDSKFPNKSKEFEIVCLNKAQKILKETPKHINEYFEKNNVQFKNKVSVHSMYIEQG